MISDELSKIIKAATSQTAYCFGIVAFQKLSQHNNSHRICSIKNVFLKISQKFTGKQHLCQSLFNPFVPNTIFLYTLKTSGNLTGFWCFQGLEKGCIGNEWADKVTGLVTSTSLLQDIFRCLPPRTCNKK